MPIRRLLVLAGLVLTVAHLAGYDLPGSINMPGSPTHAGGIEQQMLFAVNAERQRQGLPSLRLDSALGRAAQGHADDMGRGGFMSHTGSDGSDAGARLQRAGYRYMSYGENVGRGYRDVAKVVRGWMNSPGHRRNILGAGFRDLGVGFAQGHQDGNTPGTYWVIVLGSR